MVRRCVCLLGGKECSLFETFVVVKTPALIPYYRRTISAKTLCHRYLTGFEMILVEMILEWLRMKQNMIVFFLKLMTKNTRQSSCLHVFFRTALLKKL